MFSCSARWSFLAALGLYLVHAAAVSAAPAPKPSNEQLRSQLEALWTDLKTNDELVAGRAILSLAALRDDAVEFLAEKMQPLQLARERLDLLLVQLGGDDEKAASSAFEELCYFDPRLALDHQELQNALLVNNQAVSRRLAAVLCDLPIDAFSGKHWHWHSPDNVVLRFNSDSISNRDTPIGVERIGADQKKALWSRAIRAISVLEHLDTPKALAVLDRMAEGHADAGPTKAARQAIARLKARR